jgi:hypothetical protein
MADFETQIKESQAQVAEAQAKISAITSRIEEGPVEAGPGRLAGRGKRHAGGCAQAHRPDERQYRRADHGAGRCDRGFSAEFDEMRTKTGMESFIGIFSSAKAESMRQERMRSASIDDKLQDLISKSDVIVKLLQGQLDLLNGQKTKVETNLAGTLTEREETVGALEAVRAEIAGMDPKIIELENRIASSRTPRRGPSWRPSWRAERQATTRWCRTNR